MQTYTYPSDIDGKPITIENPLRLEHVKVGQLLWFEGFTVTFGWNCPAVITHVDEEKRTFRVRSLDDMREQRQEYAFSADDSHDTSRKSMRLVDVAEVKAYVERQKSVLERSVESAKEALRTNEQKLAHFNDVLVTLGL